jgi:hypothetical protein
MKCEVCQKNIGEVMVILPRHSGDGKLDTMACLSCSEKSDAYCKKHVRPHLGFTDGTTACIYCVNELTLTNKDKAEAIRERIYQVLSAHDLSDLKEAVEIAAHFGNCSRHLALLRFIASKAVRSHHTIGQVTDKIIEEHSPRSILWQ